MVFCRLLNFSDITPLHFIRAPTRCTCYDPNTDCSMACITAPFQTIRHSCCHLSLKGHCRIWGRQTSRGFLTEGPSRWIKWVEMPGKHLTYMKVCPGHMHYRALSRPVKTSRDPKLLFLQQKDIYLKTC